MADGLGNQVAHTAESRADCVESVRSTVEVGIEAACGFALDHDGEQHESAGFQSGHQGGLIIAGVARTVDIDVLLALQGCPNRAIGSVHGELEAIQKVIHQLCACQASTNESQTLVHQAEYYAVETGGPHRIEEHRDKRSRARSACLERRSVSVGI